MILNATLLLKKHWPGILIAIIAGLVISLPNFIFTHSKQYEGLPMMYTDYEAYYLVRMDSAHEGCIMSCNPYIKDYGAMFPFFDPSISTLLLDLPGMIIGISVIPLQIAYNFILPAIITLLSYGLIIRLTGNRTLSVWGAVTIVLGFSLINSQDIIGIQNIIDLLNGHLEYPRFLLYSRPVNPQLSSIIFLIYIHLLLSFLKNPDRRKFWLLTLVYASSFYIYFYTCTFLTVVNGLLICLYFIKKDYQKARYLVFATLIGIVCAIPIINEMAQLVSHPYYTNLSHYEITDTHLPSISLRGLSFLFIIFATITYLKKKNVSFDDTHRVFLALILAIFVVHNQHIITGKIIQNFHYDWYFATPIMIVCGAYILFIIFKNPSRKQHIILVSVMGIVIGNAIFIQYSTYKQRLPQAIEEQRLMPVIKYLSSHIPPRSIIAVATSGILPEIIPIFTHDYVAWSSPAEILYLHYLPQFHWETFIDSPKALREESKKFGANYMIIDSNFSKTSIWKEEIDKKDIVYNDGFMAILKIN